MKLADPTRRIKEARTYLLDQGRIPEGLVPKAIERSWKRCVSIGLPINEKQNCDPLSVGALSAIREQNQMLVAHAEPIMETLREQIQNTCSMVILTDASGLILRSMGDADFIKRAKRVALQTGVSWDENKNGTNAIGTSLAEKRPVFVHGGHHYIAANTLLTCSAAPIANPHGQFIGVLDVSGDHRIYQPHTLALVRMSAQMIENRLFREEFPNSVVLHFHSRPEFVGTLCEGMVVFYQDGLLVSANRSGLLQLGMGLEELRQHTFQSLFDLPFDALFDHVSHRAAGILALNLRNGIRVYGSIEFGSSLKRETTIPLCVPNVARSARPVGRTARASSCPSLESLSLGDERMAQAVAKAKRVIGRDIPVLIIGETGTGKELFARAIHYEAPRRDGPFVAVNCAAIPEGLIESELFGYEEGAFTGAKRKGAIGKVLQAHGGTLFLDEIGDMPLNLQARLLRVLQDRQVTPLGSAKSYPVDIHIVCATHCKLRELVARGDFRADLYYRLNGLVIQLPRLRERTDIRQLVERLLERECAGMGRVSVSPEAMSLFESHPWPGNIRQMANLLRAAVAMLERESVITRAHLSEDFLEDTCSADSAEFTAAAAPHPMPLEGDLEALEVAAIRRALEAHRGNVSAAARQLGISRNTLYRKLKHG
ncbi:MAG TPA: sigma-54-dependent Fis family transcriptional regulator [Burkholderiales bacterium]|nr:sigma-54-dependent Fis family transcriptional regulator [Burkholderiales bacterium]